MASTAFRTAAGVGLHMEAEGARDAPVTCVLAHGWTLDARSWGSVAQALTSAGRPPVRVIRYDHRNHGRSDSVPRDGMTIEALADDLAELVGELVPAGPLVLGGHSMGGMTIMAFAERHPALFAERVAGVALVSTAAGGLGDATLGLSVRALGMIRKGEAKLAESPRFNARPRLSRRPLLLAPGLRALLVGRGADRGALGITARCIADCRPSAMTGFRPTLNAHERDAALEVFDDVPTEVLVGTRDKLTPVHQARRIVKSARRARLTLYPGAGHMLPVERVDGVAGCLARLVDGAVSRGSSGSVPAPATPGATSGRQLPPGAPTGRSRASTAR